MCPFLLKKGIKMSKQTNALSSNELEARLQKVENIRARDGIVWKDKFERTATIAEIRKMQDGTNVCVPGRVTALRWLGKLMFGRIYDINGEIQFSMSREELGEEQYKFSSQMWIWAILLELLANYIIQQRVN